MKILSSYENIYAGMKLVRFRVQNYKKVNDSGWVTCSDLTTFVGKNEAGKSVTLRGLSKLNPSDGQPYDGLKEFPRRRFSDEFEKQDWVASSAEFQLSADEIREMENGFPILKGIKSVIVSRHYSGKMNFEFVPNYHLADTSIGTFTTHLRKWHDIIQDVTVENGRGERIQAIKAAAMPFLQQEIKQLEGKSSTSETTDEQFNKVNNTLTPNFNETWEKETFKAVVGDLEQFRSQFQDRNQVKKAEEWVKKNMPKFLYFDRYDVIESAIDVLHFITRLKENPTDPRLRTTKCLFQHVGLDLNRITGLDPARTDKSTDELRRMADERSIRMSSASAAMTAKFSDWWEQRKHRFRYQLDGRWFRVWVSDDLDPSEIELDQRSAGMQYFFSFYLVFLVEAEGAHRNSIILLDEPGLHYHGTAQQKTVEFLEKLSKENQILYTTHSPFMIDGGHLERVRIVHEDEKDGSTRVSDDVWPNDKDALFPLQAGLGYALAQTLFYAKKQVVVEGLTDYTILKAMDEHLSSKKRTTLPRDAIITAAGGIRNLMPLASILHGNEVKMAILLDGDQAGMTKAKEVKEMLRLDCLFVSTYANKQGATIEDMFPDDLFLDAIKEAYPAVALNFDAKEQKMPSITARTSSLFKRTGAEEFEKWRPINILAEWIRSPHPKHPIPEKTAERFETLFREVNSILS